MAREKKKVSALTSEEKLVQALIPEKQQPYKVPENWCWIKQGNISTFLNGRAYKQKELLVDEQMTPVLRVGNLFTNGSWYYSNLTLEENKYLNNGDLIYAWSASFGPFIWQGGKVIYHYHIWKILVSKVLSKNYYYYWLMHDTERLKSGGHGLGMIHVTKEMMENSPMPLPPSPEQQRIVDRIEYLFAKLDEAKEKAQSVLDSFDTRKAAILHKAFTGELTAKWRAAHSLDIASWKNLYLKDICDYMKAGGDKPVDFVDEQDDVHCIPVVANGISNEGIIGYSAESKYDGETVTVSGRGTIGYSIYRNYPYYPVVRLIVLGPKKDVYAKFLKYAFNAFPEEGTGSSIPQLTVPMIKEKVIPVPCIEEQVEIVRILDSLFAKEQQAKEAAEAVLEKIDLLKKSILARAFRGELGTNDPTEGSALELLKGIL